MDRRGFTVSWTIGAAVWVLAAWSVLQTQHLPDTSLHSLCGPWGCGPPLTVIVACHGFWVVLLLPPTWLASRRAPPRILLIMGTTMLLLGAAGIAGTAIAETTHWLSQASQWQRDYFVQRWWFSVATNVDVPMVELLIAGIATTTAGLLRSRSSRPNSGGTRRTETTEPVFADSRPDE